MSIFIPILATFLFGFFSLICFYYTFKPYKDDDESYLDLFTYDFGFLAIMSMFFECILWVCRKLLPQNVYVLIFRIISFLIGLIMVGVSIVFWLLF
ncbi:putative membrane-anchored protein [Salirhabdus euzebyi]|uniref:Putative membrane-anchored protein n=1 Tax=Salirhabdus euzebyi TaxID=394506 RepID=A0A841Q2F6_9BACI|nr:putative membrane-anchored protein [Salirhabdus euzebyi]